MRRWLVLLAWTACQAPAEAETRWFTVTGNPGDALVDTVQVDPVAVHVKGGFKTMKLRVSRASPRLNWEQLPYRSYEARVVFDCRARKGSYVYAIYYAVPLWAGDPHNVTDYAGNPRPMLFRDIEPNPTDRIVRAACRTMTS